jgi:hypothetical protein
MNIVEESDTGFGPLWAALLEGHKNPTPAISQSHFDFRRHYLGDRMEGRFQALVAEKGKPLCGSAFEIVRDAAGHRVLDAVAVPSAMIMARDAEPALLKGAEAMMREHISGLLDQYKADRLIFLDQMIGGGLSPLAIWALNKGANVEVQFTQVIDLAKDEAALWSDLGKSCKWRVNWGLKNLAVEVTNDVAAFDHLRRLHLAAAGFATRSAATWDIQREMVQRDEAFLVTAALDGEVVSAALFQCSKDDCYYGVSASDRNLFDKPLGHVTLWQAIRRARARGCARFISGSQVWEHYRAHDEPVTRKEASIAEFKRSFGGSTVPEIVVNLKHRPADARRPGDAP